MLRSVAIFVLCILLLPVGGRADTLAQIQADNDAFFAQDFSCKRDDAKPVPLGEALDHPDQFYNTCLRLHGVMHNGVIAEKITDDPLDYGNIGLNWGSLPRSDFEDRRVEIVGRLRSCAERFARFDKFLKAKGDRGSVMLTDACHSFASALYVSWAQAD